MLIDLTTLKKYMQIADTDRDDVLNLYIPAVSAAIEDYCNRKFNQANYDELVDGTGLNFMDDLQYPITTFTSLTIDDEVIDAGDYKVYLNEGVVKMNFIIRAGNQNVRRVYTAGYATIPEQIQLATYITLSSVFEKSNRFSVVSEGGNGITTKTFLAGDIPDYAKTLLKNYKRPERPKQSGNLFLQTV